MGNRRAATTATFLPILVLLLAIGFAPDATARPNAFACPQGLSKFIPKRPADAWTGSGFVQHVAGISDVDREVLIGSQLLAGNVPDFLRHLKPVVLRGEIPGGRFITITICVAPDYLALGTDDDFLRIPMGLRNALTISRDYGFVLPTRKMVDAIYDQAEVRVAPQPLPPTDQMRSTAYYWNHNGRIHDQLAAAAAAAGILLAGQKKDLVVTNQLFSKPGRVAIYGWHLASGHPIQPLSLVHGARYADYSHGVRLVSAIVYVNGLPRSIFDVLADRKLAPIVSDEGPIDYVGELAAALGGGPESRVLVPVAAAPVSDSGAARGDATLQLGMVPIAQLRPVNTLPFTALLTDKADAE